MGKSLRGFRVKCFFAGFGFSIDGKRLSWVLVAVNRTSGKSFDVNHILSIPFIGIFALHPKKKMKKKNQNHIAFNSLYWDFCSASVRSRPSPRQLILHFNSLYWDFCSASSVVAVATSNSSSYFNSLYWDFCSASTCRIYRRGKTLWQFQFPLLGFLLCILWSCSAKNTLKQ